MGLLDESRQIRHLLRRAGFSMSRASLAAYQSIYDSTPGSHQQKYEALVDALINVSYQPYPDDGDGAGPGGLGLTTPFVRARMLNLSTTGATIQSVPPEPADPLAPAADQLHPPKPADNGRGVLAFGSDSALRQWWVLRMIYTSRPHLEKMTLFWHNHLTSNASTVANQNYMGMQNDFFRRNAHGSFLDILRGITRDAAMLRYLDNDSNIVTRTGRDGVTYWEGSNENYGRELLELYGLGISSGYTEDDVKACARALTGWGLDFGNGTTRFRFRYNEHVSAKFLPPDALPGFPGQGPSGQAPFRFLGEDRVWGQITTPAEAGNANGDWFGTYPYDTSWKNPQFDPHQKIVDWTGYDGGTQPKAGIHIARKLWLFFGGPLSALSQSDLDAMVEAYRGQGPYTSGQYGIKGMLKTLFMSTSFRSDTAYRSLVKSPVEFLVGVLRGLQAPGTFGGSAFSTPTETGNTAADLRNMDQDLLNPPFPSGWDGFDSWINSTTWMARLNVLNSILNRRTTPSSVTPTTVSDFFNANAYIAQYGLTSWQSTIDHLLDTFLDIRPGSPAPSDVPAPAPAAIHAGGSTSIAMPVLYRGSGPSAVNEYETWSARLNAYVQSVPWTATPDTTGTNAQPSAQAKFRGLVYLVLGSPEFQLA